LNWSKWIRHIHRWLSIVFTATVIANFAAIALGQPPAWLVYSPLLPLFLLLLGGLYMFALPYAANSPIPTFAFRLGRASEQMSESKDH
jgi:hypothetical protein